MNRSGFEHLQRLVRISFPEHLLVQVFVDGRPDVLVDIDYSEQILSTRPAEGSDEPA